MRLDTRMRGDFFEVSFVLLERDVLAGCSGQTCVVGAKEDQLRRDTGINGGTFTTAA